MSRWCQEGLAEGQAAVGRAESNLLGLWPVHFCGNSWAESKAGVGWASPELRVTAEAGTPAQSQEKEMGEPGPLKARRSICFPFPHLLLLGLASGRLL